jgi:uncharacterized protein (TIGR03084 family)
MMQQALDFKAESEALYTIVAPLSDSELETKTLFKEWTFNDIIGHLYVWNQAANLTLKDGDAFREFFKTVIAAGSLRKFETERLGDLRGRKLVQMWHEHFIETAESYGRTNPKTRVKWAGPDMTERSKITARLMETWAHGQAIYDQLGLVRKNADLIQNIVQLGVNTYNWTYNVRQSKAPGPMPHLKLEAPSGVIWKYGDEGQSDYIEGLAEEFCQVVTQCRNIVDTNLKVVGPVAQDWMAKAQCFAGGEEPPPRPGARRIVAKL